MASRIMSIDSSGSETAPKRREKPKRWLPEMEAMVPRGMEKP